MQNSCPHSVFGEICPKPDTGIREEYSIEAAGSVVASRSTHILNVVSSRTRLAVELWSEVPNPCSFSKCVSVMESIHNHGICILIK